MREDADVGRGGVDHHEQVLERFPVRDGSKSASAERNKESEGKSPTSSGIDQPNVVPVVPSSQTADTDPQTWYSSSPVPPL